jgi:ribosome-associated protein|tara:strand:- start:948 stop:1304 length:357 start_codon:yes stop_codon:yes gene_type:complete
MTIKQELQRLTSKLDKSSRKLAAAKERGDRAIVLQFQVEIEALTKAIASAKNQNDREVSSKGDNIKAMAFNRELTKAEQADMGKLKKSVRGLVVVHPLTALGRELAIEKVTGFASKKF